MAKQTVDIGTAANDGTGDPLRSAFTKVNQNFDEVYSTYTMTGKLTVGNSTVNSSLANTTGMRTGNTTWNATVNSTSIRISNFANTAILNGSSLTIGSNVIANQTAYFVGNSTVNSVVTGTGLVAGIVTVNNSTIRVGSNVAVNSSAILIGNSTSNLVISQGILTGNVLLNGSLTVNGTMTSVNTISLEVADINITVAKNAANAAVANGAGITIAGASATMNYISATNNFLFSHSLAIGNTSNNGTLTQTNYSGTANNANNLGQIAASYFVANTDGGLTQNTSGHFIVANTGTVANSSGLFVNAAYIATIAANNASFLGGVAAAKYVQNTDSRTLSGNLVIGGTYFNPTSNTVLLGNSTQRWVISGNTGTFSDTVDAPTFAVGSVYVVNSTAIYYGTINSTSYGTVIDDETITVGNALTNVVINSTSFSGTANNALNLGGSLAANFVQNTDSRTLSGNLVFSGANVVYSSGLFVGANVNLSTTQLTIGNSTVNTITNATNFSGTSNNTVYAFGKSQIDLNVNNALTSNSSLQANNASNLGGVAAASYVQNTDSRTLSGNLVISGTHFNPSSNTILLGNSTQRWVLSANTGDFSDQVNAASYTIGSSYIANGAGIHYGIISPSTSGVFANSTEIVVGDSFTQVVINSTAFSGTANNSDRLGGVLAASYVQNTDSRTLSGNLYFTGSNNVFYSGLSVGANVLINTSQLKIGNSTVNTTVNSTIFTGTANNSTYVYGKQEIDLNVNSAILANNSTYAYGKTESALNVNNATYAYSKVEGALNVNNATYAYGKNEIALNVNSAIFANNTTYAYGKLESALNVNNATYAYGKTESTLSVNNATYAFGKLESAINANSALNANNANNLGNVAAANFVQNTDSRTLSGNLVFSGANVQFTGANVQFTNGLSGALKPRSNNASSASSPLAWNSDQYDQYTITAQSTALTISADSGSPTNGQKIMFRIKDNGTARALTWANAVSKGFRTVGTSLPATTSVNKTIYVGAVYNADDQRWDVIGVAIET